MKGKGKGPVYRIAGAMSGTSMDGVDVAVIETDGRDVFDFGPTAYRPFSDAERLILRNGMGKWPGEPGVHAVANLIETAHVDAMAGVRDVVVLGFHGQTLAHDPDAGVTHQAGDGARLSEALGLPVIWDFRSADVALGGQGAPLAPFYHWALARKIGAVEPVAFLNLGGVGNITWVDPRAETPDQPGALLAFDTGPANAPLDDLMMARGLGDFDTDGALAATGAAHVGVLTAFLNDRYFARKPPKSLDRNGFPGLLPAMATLSDADAMASLVAAIAGSVAQGFSWLPEAPSQLLVAGGGRKNRAILQTLAERLPCPVSPVETHGLDGDALEAQAFAYLAIRVALGLTTSAPGTTGVANPIGGGQIAGKLNL